jgi:hypothetical protein
MIINLNMKKEKEGGDSASHSMPEESKEERLYNALNARLRVARNNQEFFVE